MAKKLAKKRRRWVLGKNFNAWVYKWRSGEYSTKVKPRQQQTKPTAWGPGKWVRVQFVEVE